MPSWGMAMANIENAKRAAGFAAQAVQRARKAREQLVTKNEKRDQKVLGRALIRGYEAIAMADPADIEVRAFLAVQNWRNS